MTKVLPEFDAAILARDSEVRWKAGKPIRTKDVSLPSLDGIPIAVKDNFSTMQLATTCASGMLRDYRGAMDAAAVELLEDAGAVIIGKTNMDEFAMGSMGVHSFFGPCINPFNAHPPSSLTEAGSTSAKRVAGGSSSGSAAAVAVGMAFAALGSDTGGSVRLPAAFCGVFGFKPSYGRISRWGLIAYANTLDTVGILAKSVRDCRTVYDVLNRYDPRDPTSSYVLHHLHEPRRLASPSDPSKPLAGVRIGIPLEYRPQELSPTMLRRWSRAAYVLEDLGAECVSVSLPHTKLALPAYYVLAPAEASSNLARFDGVRYGYRSERGEGSVSGDDLPLQNNLRPAGAMYADTRTEGFGEEVKRRIMLGTFVLREDAYNSYFLHAQKYRRLVKKDFDDVFRMPNPLDESPQTPADSPKIDILLTPAAVGTAPILEDVRSRRNPVEEYVNDVMTIPASLAGLPALVFPFGSSREDGFPIGLQLLSQYGDEEYLFDVASVFHDAVKSQSAINE
ncbi:glutamyl-tRNA amidotransferase [Hyaloraphidium curvatum]|nr:glutamyl-tRNA amidotransferase [Hyaloraphidium curvatum]